MTKQDARYQARTEDNLKGVSLLGNQNVKYAFEYAPEILEAFPNGDPEHDYFVKFNCPEFTSLCPKTLQPDFGTMYINYIPSEKMVESKSLKLYLFSFRNHGDFHEACTVRIMNDLVKLLEPKYLEVQSKFLPRGGISIDTFANYGKPGTKYETLAETRLFSHDIQFENVGNR